MLRLVTTRYKDRGFYLRGLESYSLYLTSKQNVRSLLESTSPRPQTIRSLTTMSSKLIAIVAGVGPGTGAAVARKFATAYPVVLLARNPENYEALEKEINDKGGEAIGISTDVSNSDSVKNALEAIQQKFGKDVTAAVCFTAEWFYSMSTY